MRSRWFRGSLALVFALTLVPGLAPAPLLAADGELDVAGFNPPLGVWGLEWDALVPGGGLVAPDGVAVVLGAHQGIDWFWWRTGTGQQPCTLTPPLATSAYVRDATFDGSGRLLLAGNAYFPALGWTIVVARFLYPDCTLDPSFGSGGYVVFDLVETLVGARIRTQSLFVLGNFVERIVVAANVQPLAGGTDALDLIVVRFRADGSLDTNFTGDGFAIYDLDGVTNQLVDLEIDSGNGLLLAGNYVPDAANTEGTLTRVLPSGLLDAGFGTAGWRRLVFEAGARSELGAIALAPNGDPLIAGRSVVGAAVQLAVFRLHGASLEGALFPLVGQNVVFDAVAQGDGKLVVVGASDGFDGEVDPFAVRVLVPSSGTPAIDESFGDGAPPDPLTYLALPVGTDGEDYAQSVDLMAGRPVVFGGYEIPSGDGVFAARLTNAYIFADGFERGSTAAW